MITGLSTAVSGLRAAQTGLSVTGHNMSNSEVPGYTRQQAMQQSFLYKGIGSSGRGLMQVGLGTDISQIRQIRSQFLDAEYRNQYSKGSYYGAKFNTGIEIQNIFGELGKFEDLDVKYRPQDVINDIWSALNELTVNPEGIDARGVFIESCMTFLTKIKDVSTNLKSYQENLNEQVKDTVNQINSKIDRIDELNRKISESEAWGDNANDYMDERNTLLDELSGLADITIKEKNNNNRVDILINGKELLVNGAKRKLGLKYCEGGNGFVEPVFTKSEEILSADDTLAEEVYDKLDNENLKQSGAVTEGYLKGLLISRGKMEANYTTNPEATKNYVIPEIQRQMDTLFHGVVTLLNDSFAPLTGDQPSGLDGSKGTELFVRKSGYDRYNNLENPDDYNSLYTIGNVEINPEFLKPEGYNKLPVSSSGAIGDASLILDIMDKWKNGLDSLGGQDIDNFYRSIVTNLGIETQESGTYTTTQNGLMQTVNNKRLSLSGVSLDEEMTNMLKYQHAYNASAKILNIVDGMLDKIINQTGRAGR